VQLHSECQGWLQSLGSLNVFPRSASKMAGMGRRAQFLSSVPVQVPTSLTVAWSTNLLQSEQPKTEWAARRCEVLYDDIFAIIHSQFCPKVNL
jgi:hypothetical protein